MLAGAAALVVAGRASDSYGRRPALAGGFTLLALGAGVIGGAVAVGSYALLMAGAIVFGLGCAAGADGAGGGRRPVPVGAAGARGRPGHLGGRRSGRSPGRCSASRARRRLDRWWASARHAPPWLAAIPICLGAAAVIWSIRPDPKAVAADLERWWPGMARPCRRGARGAARAGELLALAPARRAPLAAVAAQATMLGVMSVTAAELDDAGSGEVVINLLMSAHFVGMFAFAAPIGLAADRYGRRA